MIDIYIYIYTHMYTSIFFMHERKRCAASIHISIRATGTHFPKQFDLMSETGVASS